MNARQAIGKICYARQCCMGLVVYSGPWQPWTLYKLLPITHTWSRAHHSRKTRENYAAQEDGALYYLWRQRFWSDRILSLQLFCSHGAQAAPGGVWNPTENPLSCRVNPTSVARDNTERHPPRAVIFSGLREWGPTWQGCSTAVNGKIQEITMKWSMGSTIYKPWQPWTMYKLAPLHMVQGRGIPQWMDKSRK